MLPRLTVRALQRNASHIVMALVLLGPWSAAWAAPLQEAQAPPPASTHPHTQRAMPPDFAATALAMVRLKTRPVPFDGPRGQLSEHVEYRDVQAAADRNPGQRPSGASDISAPFPIRWRESAGIVGPDVVSLVRNYHRDGLPVVHLWQSNQSTVALGLNPHGVPGIYFTRHLTE
jgi:hypothetical protein